MAVLRRSLRCLGRCRVDHDCCLLLPATQSEQQRFDDQGDYPANRFYWRFIEHFWYDFVHGGLAVGWLPGKHPFSVILRITALEILSDNCQYPWKSAHVLVPLILGVVLLALFCVWESKFAKFPMFPSRLKQDPRILALTLVITFISGANFFSILMFWPTQAFNVYGQDPIGVGIRGLPIGFSILAGACIVLWLLSVFRGHNKELMIISSVLMTAGQFSS